MKKMTQRGYEIGMAGLGASGRSLALNMLDHGITVAAYSEDFLEARTIEDQVESKGLRAARTLDEFLRLLRTPRAILLPPQGRRDLEVWIARLSPRMKRGDVLVDASDSYFRIPTCGPARWRKMASSFWEWASPDVSMNCATGPA